jgi:thiamine-monophosphate kinase
MTAPKPPILSDFGEFRILSEVVLPLARRADPSTEAGDDCTFIAVGDRWLAISADVGPRSLIDFLPNHSRDFEAGGWLAAVATISDIATAGAKPLFMTNCVDAPPDLPVEHLDLFMQGYFRACAQFGFQNGGGDIRQGQSLIARVFGVGLVEHRKIGRGTAKPGDVLVSIGPTGQVMSTYLLALVGNSSVYADGTLTCKATEILRFPQPRLREMEQLGSAHLITAASDTSDGLLGAIDNISRRSGLGFELELRPELLPEYVNQAAHHAKLDSPWNLFFCWGDWSIAATVSPKDIEQFRGLCLSEGIEFAVLGHMTSSGPATARIGRARALILNILRNENFTSRGYNEGLSGHLEYILRTPLFNERPQ